MSLARRLALLAFATVAFGVLMAVIKGQDAGARDAIGNASAPWVLLPFLAGATMRRPLAAAAVGFAATALAFAGFYVTEAFVLDLGPHPWYVDLKLAAGTLNVYEKVGFVTGPTYGMLGFAWHAQRRVEAAVALGLAFVCEPLIVLAVQRAHLWGGGGVLDHPGVWISEVCLGVALTAALVRRARQT